MRFQRNNRCVFTFTIAEYRENMKYIIVVATFLLVACGTTTSQGDMKSTESHEKMDLSGLETAYFASGCFWCVEAVYESVNGVAESISGYAGGHTEYPTYASSNTGTTGHAEAVEIYYNPDVVSFETLVKVYYASQDPTQVNGQGPDHGSQYRSILFYKNEAQKQIIEQYMIEVAKDYDKPLATEVQEFQKFWVGEDYHQDFEKLHPNQSYIRAVSVPRLKRFQAKHPELIKKAESH